MYEEEKKELRNYLIRLEKYEEVYCPSDIDKSVELFEIKRILFLVLLICTDDDGKVV